MAGNYHTTALGQRKNAPKFRVIYEAWRKGSTYRVVGAAHGVCTTRVLAIVHRAMPILQRTPSSPRPRLPGSHDAD